MCELVALIVIKLLAFHYDILVSAGAYCGHFGQPVFGSKRCYGTVYHINAAASDEGSVKTVFLNCFYCSYSHKAIGRAVHRTTSTDRRDLRITCQDLEYIDHITHDDQPS